LILRKLDRLSRELVRTTELLAEIEEEERDAIDQHTTLDHQLTKLRVASQESNLQNHLSLVRHEGLGLKHQVEQFKSCPI
jgi:hypothetical protein